MNAIGKWLLLIYRDFRKYGLSLHDYLTINSTDKDFAVSIYPLIETRDAQITNKAADSRGYASGRLAAIEASVRALADEDLLDLADIFARGQPTPLTEMTARIMAERHIKL